MSPIRRYLRISPHLVLEVRIYLDNPADATRWLLNPREPDPVLPRVIAAVRPLVVPKLKEEEERNRGRGKGKGGKKKGVRDVVQSDGFEVSIFLTESSTRHSILMRHKTFLGTGTKLKGNSSKMTGTKDEPVEVGGEDEEDDVVVMEEEDDTEMNLGVIPVADDIETGHPSLQAPNPEGLFVSDTDSESGFEDHSNHLHVAATSSTTARSKRRESVQGVRVDAQGDGTDDKKKAAFNTTYEGFSIYRRILCLVVKRRGISKGKQLVGGAGQAMMEDWITSSQMMQGQVMDE